MFKSIQWKVLTVFILLVVSVMIIVGTFLLSSVNRYYLNEFSVQMEKMVFVNDLKAQLAEAAGEEEPISAINSLLELYGGRIGTDLYRNYYILEGLTVGRTPFSTLRPISLPL